MFSELTITLPLGEGVGLGQQANLQILVIGEQGSKPHNLRYVNRNASSAIARGIGKRGYPSDSIITEIRRYVSSRAEHGLSEARVM